MFPRRLESGSRHAPFIAPRRQLAYTSGDRLRLTIVEGQDSEMSSSTFVSKSRARLIRTVRQKFIVQDWNEVLTFLKGNPTLVPLLIESYEVIEAVFGPNSRVELRLKTDPEIEELTILFGYIGTNLSVEQAMAKLDEFDDKWFLANLNRADGKLNFDLMFV